MAGLMQISLKDQAANELAKFNERIAGLSEYKLMTVAEHGIGKVTKCRQAVKQLRLDIEEKRKELKADSLEYGRTVDGIAKQLTAVVRDVEDTLAAQEAEHEAEKQRVKAAKEAERMAALNARIDRMINAGVMPENRVQIEAMTAEEFESHLAAEIVKAAEAKAEAERLEQLRLEEAERQANEIRIREEELRAEQMRLDAERAAEAERQRIEREAIEAERAEMRREQEELQRQQQALRAKAEAEAAEQRRIAREAEEERQAEVLRLRLEALKPEIEKAEAFVSALLIAAEDSIRRLNSPGWSDEALQAVKNCGRSIVAMVRDR